MYHLNVDKLITHILKACGLVRTPITHRTTPLSLLLEPLEMLKIRVGRAIPVSEWCPYKISWNSDNHLGRIRYLLEQGCQDPIKVDISNVSGLLYIKDGQHRLVAAVCAGRTTIAAEYVGRTDIPFAQELLSALT